MKAKEYFKKIENLLESVLPKSNYIELDATLANEQEPGLHAGQIYATIQQEYIIKLSFELPEKFALRVSTFEKCEVPLDDMFDVYLCGSGFEFDVDNIPAPPKLNDSDLKSHLISTLSKIMNDIHHSSKVEHIKSYLPYNPKKYEERIGHLLKTDDDYILVGLGTQENQFFIDAIIICEGELNQLDKFLQELGLVSNRAIH